MTFHANMLHTWSCLGNIQLNKKHQQLFYGRIHQRIKPTCMTLLPWMIPNHRKLVTRSSLGYCEMHGTSRGKETGPRLVKWWFKWFQLTKCASWFFRLQNWHMCRPWSICCGRQRNRRWTWQFCQNSLWNTRRNVQINQNCLMTTSLLWCCLDWPSRGNCT